MLASQFCEEFGTGRVAGVQKRPHNEPGCIAFPATHESPRLRVSVAADGISKDGLLRVSVLLWLEPLRIHRFGRAPAVEGAEAEGGV